MATLQDVAKLAGVAPITVSRVVNNTGYVREDTRLRVEAAIRELQYIPNTISRSGIVAHMHRRIEKFVELSV